VRAASPAAVGIADAGLLARADPTSDIPGDADGKGDMRGESNRRAARICASSPSGLGEGARSVRNWSCIVLGERLVWGGHDEASARGDGEREASTDVEWKAEVGAGDILFVRGDDVGLALLRG